MAKLSVKGLALACGVTWAICVIILAIMAKFGWGMSWVILLGTVYKGYRVSFGGALIGAVWAFFDAGIGGAVIALLYNFFSKK